MDRGNKAKNSRLTSPVQLERNLEDQSDVVDCGALSWKVRLFGFFGCVFVGLMLTVMAYPMMSVNPSSFGVLYAMANLVFLSGTAFIVGPIRQFQTMFQPDRILSALIYLFATVAVLVVAMRRLLVLAAVLLVVQVISLVWYAMSYVPYAQQLMQKLFFP